MIKAGTVMYILLLRGTDHPGEEYFVLNCVFSAH